MHLWLQGTFSEVPNIKVLDVFGLLANSAGTLDRKYHRIAFHDQHPNRQGSKVIADELKSLLS